MRVAFMAAQKEREQELAVAFAAGCETHGDECVIAHNGGDIPPGVEAVAMIGVKSRGLYERTVATGLVPIMFDKGYVRARRAGGRTWEFWRVSVGAHHPTTTTLPRYDYPADRFETLGLHVAPWRQRGSTIVFAGSSEKYHDFYRLPHPTEYAQRIVESLNVAYDLPVIYRPKPSWRGAEPVTGADFSPRSQTLNDALGSAYALVTHGSNACFEAMLAGVPSIVLGSGVARSISATAVGEPLRRGHREQLLANLAYHQWTEDEIHAGSMWEHARKWTHDLRTV